MNTPPPEATPERLAWVASLKEGDEVWRATAIDRRRDLHKISKRVAWSEYAEGDSGFYNLLEVRGCALSERGTLSSPGYQSWIEPVTDEERIVLAYKPMYDALEVRLYRLRRKCQYGVEEKSVAECVEEIKRISKLLNEAGL